MSELKKIQQIEFDILKTIDRVCCDFNIEYTIIGGTFLGAIRHNGFIPWDDDIDICMTYDGFKRFEKVFHEKGLFLQTPKSEPNMPFIIYKVRKDDTKMVERNMGQLPIHQGVWVDIFIITKAANRSSLRKCQYMLSVLLRSYRCRALNREKNCENVLQRISNRLPLRVQLMIDDFIMWLINAMGSKRSTESFLLDNTTYDKMFEKRSFFTERDQYLFEGHYFPGPRDWDAFLIHYYGENYMTPVRYGGHV